MASAQIPCSNMTEPPPGSHLHLYHSTVRKGYLIDNMDVLQSFTVAEIMQAFVNFEISLSTSTVPDVKLDRVLVEVSGHERNLSLTLTLDHTQSVSTDPFMRQVMTILQKAAEKSARPLLRTLEFWKALAEPVVMTAYDLTRLNILQALFVNPDYTETMSNAYVSFTRVANVVLQCGWLQSTVVQLDEFDDMFFLDVSPSTDGTTLFESLQSVMVGLRNPLQTHIQIMNGTTPELVDAGVWATGLLRTIMNTDPRAAELQNLYKLKLGEDELFYSARVRRETSDRMLEERQSRTDETDDRVFTDEDDETREFREYNNKQLDELLLNEPYVTCQTVISAYEKLMGRRDGLESMKGVSSVLTYKALLPVWFQRDSGKVNTANVDELDAVAMVYTAHLNTVLKKLNHTNMVVGDLLVDPTSHKLYISPTGTGTTPTLLAALSIALGQKVCS